MSSCVVCGTSIVGEALYTNSWERSLEQHPCCSTSCASTYDADLHWKPPELPPEPPDDEHDKLMRLTRERLAAGDNPTVVVREMLLAGMPTSSLRKVVFHSSMQATESKEKTRQRNIWNIVKGMFSVLTLSPAVAYAENRDPRDPAALEEAQQEMDAWDRHFGVGTD